MQPYEFTDGGLRGRVVRTSTQDRVLLRLLQLEYSMHDLTEFLRLNQPFSQRTMDAVIATLCERGHTTAIEVAQHYRRQGPSVMSQNQLVMAFCERGIAKRQCASSPRAATGSG